MTAPGSAGVTLLGPAELADIAKRLGREISADHPEGIVLVGILKGSVCMVADLARHISVPCAVDFLVLSAYRSGGTRVRLSKDLDVDVTGRSSVVAVDLVDSGLTINYVKRLLDERGAASTDVCALLDRTRRRLVPVDIRYRGTEVGDDYVVGYGLDFEERYRNLPYITIVDPDRLRNRPPGPDVADVGGLFPL